MIYSDNDIKYTQHKRDRSLDEEYNAEVKHEESKPDLSLLEEELVEREEKFSLDLQMYGFFNPPQEAKKEKKEGIKYYSQVAPSHCFICKTEATASMKQQCPKCFKSFHNACYTFKDTQCLFCDLHSLNKCCQCQQLISDSEIEVICELCGNKIHLTCLSISIKILLQRNFYSRHFGHQRNSKAKEFFEGLQQIIQEKEREINLSTDRRVLYSSIIASIQKTTGYYEADSVSLLDHLFSLCNYCRNLPHQYPSVQTSLIYRSTYYQMVNYSAHASLDLHQMMLPSASSFKNSLISPTPEQKEALLRSEGEILRLSIKRIVDRYYLNDNTEKCYYLIKWTNGIYSCELGDFIAFHAGFQALLNEYDNRSTMRRKAPNDQYLIDQLTGLQNQDDFNYAEGLLYKSFDGNLLHFYENEEEAELKSQFLHNLISDLFNSSIRKPKILLCTDDFNFKSVWKSQARLKSLENIKLVSLNGFSPLQKIIYELIVIESKSNNTTSFSEALHSKLKLNNEREVLKCLNDYKADLYSLNANLIVISPSSLSTQSIQQLLFNFKFNLFVFDVSAQHLQPALEVLSELASFPINSGSLKYFMSQTLNIPHSLSQFIHKAFFKQSKAKVFLNKNTSLGQNKQVFNRNIYSLPFDGSLAELLLFFKESFNWEIHLNLSDGKEGCLSISQLISQMMLSTMKSSLIIMNSNVMKTIVNFIGVSFDQNEYDCYINSINSAKCDYSSSMNKKEMASSLNDLCSFSFIAEDINYVRDRYKLLQGKVNAMNRVLKRIGGIGHRILALYSLANASDDSHTFIASEIGQMTKLGSMTILQASDERVNEELDKEGFLYVLLLNSFSLEKNAGRLLKRLFVRGYLVVFQLFTINSIEQTVLREFYCNIDRYFDEGCEALMDSFAWVKGECDRNCAAWKWGDEDKEEAKQIRYSFINDTLEEEDSVIIVNGDAVLYCVNIDDLIKEYIGEAIENDDNRCETQDANDIGLEALYLDKGKDFDIDKDSDMERIEKDIAKKSSMRRSKKDEHSIDGHLGKNLNENEEDDILYDDIEEDAQNNQINSYGFPISTSSPTSRDFPQIFSELNEEEEVARQTFPLLPERPKTLKDFLISIASRLRYSNDKILQLNIFFLNRGFNYQVRETILAVLSNKGAGSSIQASEGSNRIDSLISSLQKQITDKHEATISHELLRLYVEYFAYSLIVSASDEGNTFLFLTTKPIDIKRQLLLVFIDVFSEGELIRASISDSVLDQHNLALCEENKTIITTILTNVLEDCRENGFNDYSSYIESNIQQRSQVGLVPIPKAPQTETDDKHSQAEFNELITKLYLSLLENVIDYL